MGPGFLPVVEAEARPPVGGAQQRLDGTGQVHKEVAHEEEPGTTAETETVRPVPPGWDWGGGAYMERMGATASTEATSTPTSQIPTVSSSPQVGSPLDFPRPKT